MKKKKRFISLRLVIVICRSYYAHYHIPLRVIVSVGKCQRAIFRRNRYPVNKQIMYYIVDVFARFHLPALRTYDKVYINITYIFVIIIQIKGTHLYFHYCGEAAGTLP